MANGRPRCGDPTPMVAKWTGCSSGRANGCGCSHGDRLHRGRAFGTTSRHCRTSRRSAPQGTLPGVQLQLQFANTLYPGAAGCLGRDTGALRPTSPTCRGCHVIVNRRYQAHWEVGFEDPLERTRSSVQLAQGRDGDDHRKPARPGLSKKDASARRNMLRSGCCRGCTTADEGTELFLREKLREADIAEANILAFGPVGNYGETRSPSRSPTRSRPPAQDRHLPPDHREHGSRDGIVARASSRSCRCAGSTHTPRRTSCTSCRGTRTSAHHDPAEDEIAVRRGAGACTVARSA